VGFLKTAIFSTFAIAISSEALELRSTLLYNIIYSLLAFSLTQKHVTLNDREWPFYVKFCIFVKLKFIIYLSTMDYVTTSITHHTYPHDPGVKI